MIPKEAIDYLIDPIGKRDKHDEAIAIAIDAIKKQVPKEPIWEGDGYSDGEMIYDTWYCPCCDAGYGEHELHNYCPRCGQKIAWEES